MRAIIESVGPSKAPSIKSEKCRTKLFKFQAYELPEILKTLTVPVAKDMIIWWCVVDKLFEHKLCEELRVQQPSCHETLSAVEMSAVCYASGFVIRKLYEKYKAQKCTRSESCLFVECLDNMISGSSNETEDVGAEMAVSKTLLEKTDS